MANDTIKIPSNHDTVQIDLHKAGSNALSLEHAQANLAVEAAFPPTSIDRMNPVELLRANISAHTEGVIEYRTMKLDSQILLDESGAKSSMFRKALSLFTGDESSGTLFKVPKGRPFKQYSERDLIKFESEIGGALFGPIPADHRREFFCLDEKTWIWYEEYIDIETGKTKAHTVRYEIHENGILKAYDGAQYTFLEGDELQNLADSISMYRNTVASNIYHLDPKTGQKLAN